MKRWVVVALVGLAGMYFGITWLSPGPGDGRPYNAILFWGGALIVVGATLAIMWRLLRRPLAAQPAGWVIVAFVVTLLALILLTPGPFQYGVRP